MNNVKVSHINPKANEEFCNWCQKLYGGTKEGKVKIVKGKVHDYLGMKLNSEIPNKVEVDMKEYVKDIYEEYPFQLNSNVNYPWNMKLFNSEDDQYPLKDIKEKYFTHSS